MKVFIETRLNSMAIARLQTYLVRYAPEWVELTSDFCTADLVILHVTGKRDHIEAITADLLENKQAYALVQYALRSTRNPDTGEWLEIWKDARVVWSYYDLAALVAEDGHMGAANFYCSSLGADPELFKPYGFARFYTVGMTGEDARAECLLEVKVAADRSGSLALHIRGVNDKQLVSSINNCHYLSGLRRKEGFELPAAEALLCGTRPILFDTPNFRRWFDGLAEFIPEGTYSHVVESLVEIFQGEPKPVTTAEMQEACRRFDWQRIVGGFWERCR